MSEQSIQIGRDKFRPLPAPLTRLVNGLFAAVTLLGCLWAAGAHDWVGWVLFTQQYLATVLGIGLFVCFLAVKARADEPEDRGIPWYDWLAAAGCLGVMGYIAVRYPVQPLCQALARAAGPFAATSANPPGEAPLANAAEIAARFGDKISLILDGGATQGGAPSTVRRRPRVNRPRT